MSWNTHFKLGVDQTERIVSFFGRFFLQLFFKFEQKELEVKGHARTLLFILGPPEGVQNVVNKATYFVYGE